MKIGILETGRSRAALIERFGSYPDMFKALLGRTDPSLAFEVYPVVDGEFPDGPEDCDGWVVTGSRHGVYDNLPWMKPLKDFLVRAIEARVPVVGICFGHQILAEALGGRVTKSERGWGVGPHGYEIVAPKPWMGEAEPAPLLLNAVHQDQVVELPAGAEIIASSPFCPYAALAYGDAAISFQAHPEFTIPYERALLEVMRGDSVPEPLADAALETLNAPGASNGSDRAAGWIVAFLREAAARRQAA